jgi:DNA repair exonuclease SbcCD nuclease subunit
MPRLLHMADVHLGARHNDLGPAAAAQRERQFNAFHRAVELALEEKVDVVLICGDLFDSNSQPRRSVERAAAELARLADRHIPVVIIPGTHDCYDPGSIYRVFDLPAMAGASTDQVVVLTDKRPRVEFDHLELTIHGFVFPTKRAPNSPLAGWIATRNSGDNASPRTWQVGMIHGSMAVPGRFDRDEVAFTEQEVATSGLNYLALGHWHSYRKGLAGKTTWAYPGAPEPVALDQDGAGQVLIVDLDVRSGQPMIVVTPRQVGRTKVEKLELDAAAITSQAELERSLRERADPDRVLDVRLVGVRPDTLDLHVDELERQLQGNFLRLRIRDQSAVSLPDAPLPPADTILGAYARTFGARIVDHENRGDHERAAELREALRLGILLLDDPQRVTLA